MPVIHLLAESHPLQLSRLSLAASLGSGISSTATHAEASSASVTLEPATALATSPVSPASACSSAPGSEVGSVAIRTGTTLFN